VRLGRIADFVVVRVQAPWQRARAVRAGLDHCPGEIGHAPLLGACDITENPVCGGDVGSEAFREDTSRVLDDRVADV
jgi:hypothetical protein